MTSRKGRAFLASRAVTSLADVMGSRRKVRAARTLQPSLSELGAPRMAWTTFG